MDHGTAYGVSPRQYVSIEREVDRKLVHVCDGAILGTHHVLTAAHCVSGETSESLKKLYVVAGAGSDDESSFIPTKTYHTVTKVQLPRDYVNTTCRQHEHDIAVIKVGRAFDLINDEVYKQVYLPEKNGDYEYYRAVVTGNSPNGVLQLKTEVISNENCERVSTAIVTRGTLCANFEDEVSDEVTQLFSGSPLVTSDGLIIGILNAQPRCPQHAVIKCTEQPSELRLYTRVSVYMDFIEKILRNEVSAGVEVILAGR